jgi:hypothetical protein
MRSRRSTRDGARGRQRCRAGLHDPLDLGPHRRTAKEAKRDMKSVMGEVKRVAKDAKTEVKQNAKGVKTDVKRAIKGR